MATLLGALFVFLLIIVLHEFGHFAVAKLVGITVNEFSIGMGPAIYQKDKGETTYSLRALPIGGYVAMEGEEEKSLEPGSFNNASVPARIAVVIAGAFMNVVLAIVAFTLSFLIVGFPSTTIKEVLPDSPAAIHEVLPGDQILTINGAVIESWDDITSKISASSGPVTLELKRGEEHLTKKIQPEEKEGKMAIGILPQMKKSVSESIKLGFTTTFATIAAIFQVLKSLFTGRVPVGNLSGPVGVIRFIGEGASQGFGNLLFITAYISANLALMNMLPIPALDGGKVVFLLIEAIRGKPVDEKIEAGFSYVGITLLMGLMLYVTIFSDLKNLIGG